MFQRSGLIIGYWLPLTLIPYLVCAVTGEAAKVIGTAGS